MNLQRHPIQCFSVSLLLLLLFSAFLSPLKAAAQQGQPLSPLSYDWTTPVRIFESQQNPSEPVLVADQTGVLHLFWSPFTTDGDNSIYYARWDGEIWSNPVDIIAGEQIHSPTVAIDPQGIIHMVYTDPTNVYYTQAEVAQAGSARAWSIPDPVENGQGHAHILRDPQGTLYIAFPGLSTSGPMMITSGDGGVSWSAPLQISPPLSGEAGTDYSRLALGEDGTLHYTWTELQYPQGWPPLGIFYSHSDDGGYSWSKPEQMAGNGYNQPNIIAGARNTVHLAWNGAAGTGGRYHRWSQDGGNSWSGVASVIPPPSGGSEGIPQLAIDSSGVLHLVTTYGQRVWYSSFQNRTWSEPVYIPTGDESAMPPLGQEIDPATVRHIENPAMALSLGNQLHLAFWEERPTRKMLSFWYTSKRSTADAVPPLPYPTQPAAATPALTATPAPTASPDEDLSAQLAAPGQGAIMGTGLPIILGIAPVALLLVLIFGIKYSRARKK